MNAWMSSGPTTKTRSIAGAVVAAGLVIALVASLAGNRPRQRDPSPDSTRVEAEPTLPTTAPDLTTATLTIAATHPTEVIRPVGEAALDAWGRFAVSGDLKILGPMFHPLSPQLPLLQEMAREVATDPLGLPAYSLVMPDPRIEVRTSVFATMEGLVVTTRGDGLRSEVAWRLVMAWSEEQATWRIWTIEETG